MQHYRERSPDEPPMCLAGTYSKFKEEWLKVWTNRSADCTTLLSLSKPFIVNWERQLLMKSASPDFHYQTLQMRLEGSGYDPHIQIQRWVASLSSISSVREELELLFLKLARTNGWFPKAASPQNAAYLFAHMFKGYLQREITHSLDPLVDAFYLVNIEECIPVEDTHPDYLRIQALCLDQWDSYLLLMIRQGYDRTSMSELTHIPEHTIRLERKIIWNRISTT